VLFQKVILPSVFRDELAKGPLAVRNWIADPPPWIDVRESVYAHDVSMEMLDAGEASAIALAMELHADLLLMDDREGVVAARRKGIEVTGTLGVLALAAKHGLLNLRETFDNLKGTNFRYRQETLDLLLEEASRSA
jgi:predicted nucleic acid-binding protein